MYKQLEESVQFLRSAGMDAPEIGIVLGTGLNKILDSVDVKVSVSYADIPHFPISTVEFHKGNLIYGYIHGKTGDHYARTLSFLRRVLYAANCISH